MCCFCVWSGEQMHAKPSYGSHGSSHHVRPASLGLINQRMKLGLNCLPGFSSSPPAASRYGASYISASTAPSLAPHLVHPNPLKSRPSMPSRPIHMTNSTKILKTGRPVRSNAEKMTNMRYSTQTPRTVPTQADR